jgi:hypothetical protein
MDCENGVIIFPITTLRSEYLHMEPAKDVAGDFEKKEDGMHLVINPNAPASEKASNF